MTRAVWVCRDGRLVEKYGPEDVRAPVARSSLPAPRVISDALPDLRGMHDGRHYDSKSALRRSYRAAGLEELGNDAPTTPSAPGRPKVTRDEVERAYEMVKQGYKPAPIETVRDAPAETGWVDPIGPPQPAIEGMLL